MSKKKHKSKYFDYDSKKKGKKKGKKNKSYYKTPKCKRNKGSLSKKEMKENRKIAMAPYKIPEELLDNRMKCNHADGTLSVAEFLDMPNPAISPMLEAAVTIFGEEHVRVCAACYDVLVDPDCITVDHVKTAVTTLYAAANMVLSKKRMSKGDIKAIAKDKERLKHFGKIVELMRKIQKCESESGDTSEVSLTDLNNM